ncbi:putative transferase CAF17 homolog, mitochondrial [Epargyreus clarus]|uniref:putative transferase CAF17 homolog, mitochondrial n=1 Tax=Epargyreus clarus TaxID=520877 RepID=UPI003C309AB3
MIFYQVNNFLRRRFTANQILRYVHNEVTAKALYPLEGRKLLKMKGEDASIFLQGLITNDMKHFEEGARSMYAMLLNNKGRVLFDTLIHKWEADNSFIIECDKDIAAQMQKHLKLYKLKRLVEINDINEELRLWVLTKDSSESKSKLKDIAVYKDPRLTDLGFRIISPAQMQGAEVLDRLEENEVKVESNEDGYKYLRYKLGVSEGAKDLPPGTSFPLEVNCDYLHGVSFHKGCYIGQEVTARVHHTGVVRKRIMPLKFSKAVTDNLEMDSVISVSNNPKSNLGKLKGVINDYGIGLLRVKEALEASTLNIGSYSVEVCKPNWWPIEAPKEKVIKNE